MGAKFQDIPCFIAIVFLYWNDRERLDNTLEEITSERSAGVEIWITDNASDTSYTPKVGNLPVHVIRSEVNLGYAGGINLALSEILEENFEFILLLNTDIRFGREELAAFINTAKEDHSSAIFGPVLCEGESKYYGGRDIARHLNTRLQEPGNPDYVPGTVFLCRAEAFRQVGFLDPGYFFSGEIADFCRRASERNMRLRIISEVEVMHQVEEKSSLRESLYFYYNLRNRFLFARKHYTSKYGYYAAHWILRGIRIFAGALWLGKRTKARAVFWALYDGLMGNFGNRNDRFL
ncbi:MAG: glycosyltransferase family 2 protein [Saprospiraceae bacterium]|nr:glycosyltransferase family 2 protein [Saprospiraceae bacterium]